MGGKEKKSKITLDNMIRVTWGGFRKNKMGINI
jgi:hypothetical protein